MAIDRVIIKYEAEEQSIQMSELDINPESFTDEEILSAVAQHMDIEPLREFVVTRCKEVGSDEVTSINIRPMAPYAF